MASPSPPTCSCHNLVHYASTRTPIPIPVTVKRKDNNTTTDDDATNMNAAEHKTNAEAAQPSRQEIDAAEAKAASICNLPHQPGVGCVKCTGLVSAELAHRLTPEVAAAERGAQAAPAHAQPQGEVIPPPLVSHEDKLHDHTIGDNDATKEKTTWGTEWAGRTAPDGTRVPELAVCEFDAAPPSAPKI